jgi:histidinol-phosphate/aromatic aminotransferase/cobyric acid decarboxylase-like protein
MQRSGSLTNSNARQFEGFVDLTGVIPAIPPPVAVTEALGQTGEGNEELQEALIRHRLAAEYRQNERNIVLVNDLDQALPAIAAQTTGPLVLFPPSATTAAVHEFSRLHVVEVARGHGRDGAISVEYASDLPHDALAIVASPGDPLGNVLSANDAVRLARSCKWLVIDERYAEYAGQSLLNVANEFPNVVVLRSFQARLGVTETPAGWAFASPRARALLTGVTTSLTPGIAQGVLAAFEGNTASRMTLSIVRDERSRLYRALRKLSYLQPLPSWGPFVAARVEVGERSTLLALLGASRVKVHAPKQPGLERYVRIGIGSRRDMEYLRQTLLDIAPAMLGDQLASGSRDPYRLALRGEELSQAEFSEIQKRRQRSA